MKIAAEYVESVKLSLLAQIILGLFSAMVLDGGRLFLFWVIFTAIFWIMVAIMMVRRPEEPTPVDIQIVKYGYAVVFGATVLLYFS